MTIELIPWLAQAGTGDAPAGPALQGESGGAPAAPAGTGAPAPGPGGSGFGLLLPVMVVLLLFVVLSGMSGRKEKKRREQMMRELSKGDKVQTIAGIIGTVAELHDHEVVLRVDEASNTRIRFSRSAVQQVIKSNRDKGDAKPGERPEPPQVETRPPAAARV